MPFSCRYRLAFTRIDPNKKMASARLTFDIFKSDFRSFPIIFDLLEHKMKSKNATEFYYLLGKKWTSRSEKRQIKLSSRQHSDSLKRCELGPISGNRTFELQARRSDIMKIPRPGNIMFE